ncbi:MAG: tetratricopeptide repeat protein [Myxococcota bacterium]
MEGSIWGSKNYVAHHIVNVVLHAIASLMVFGLLRALIGRDKFAAPLFGALLFAVHPTQVDSVAYISGRRDVLCGLFYFAAMWAYLTGRERDGWSKHLLWASTALLWLLALGSKEMAVTFPLVVLWHGFTIDAPARAENQTFKSRAKWLAAHRLKLLLPLFTVAAGYATYRVIVDSKSILVTEGHWWGGSFWTNLMTSLSLHRYFAELVFVPIRLVGDWHPPIVSPVESLTTPALWLGVTVLIILLVAVIWSIRSSQNLIAMGLGWYLLTLLPVSQLVPHHEILAEHYLYIPLFGILLAVSSTLEKVLHDCTTRTRILMATLALAVLLAFGLRAHLHVKDYKSPLTLANATLRWEPDHPRAMLRAASWLADEERWEEAEGYLIAALDTTASDKLRQKAYRMLGFRYLSEGKLNRLSKVVEMALQDFPNDPNFRGLKGELLRRYGRTSEGTNLLQEAAEHEEVAADIDFLAAMSFRSQGREDEAIDLLRRARTKANPNTETHRRYTLALAHMLSERTPNEASRFVESVLEQDPENAAAEKLQQSINRD